MGTRRMGLKRWISGAVGVSVLALWNSVALGAVLEGVRQAREWQYAADLALANHQPLIAYEYYEKVAKTFPDTPHGKVAAKRMKALAAQLAYPARTPATEDPFSWLEELFDFLIWP